jgi:hypothetical protein
MDGPQVGEDQFLGTNQDWIEPGRAVPYTTPAMLTYLDTAIGLAVILLGISLLITILTQMASALLSYRGSNLRWGLETLFEQIDPTALPTLKANARRLAEKVLTHSLISDSVMAGLETSTWTRRFKLASAIRPEELVSILKQIGDDPARYDFPAAIQAELNTLLDAKNPVAERQIKLLTNTSTALAGTVPLIEETVKTVQQAQGKLEAWFSSTMDRVSQRFAMQMRFWTVAFAAAIAFIGHIDSARIVKELYTSADFRATMAGQAGSMLALAQPLVPEAGGGPALSGAVSVHTDALKKLAAELKIAAPPPAVDTQGGAEQWIEQNVIDPQQRDVALKRYVELRDESFKVLMQQSAESAKRIRDTLAPAEIQLLLHPYPPHWYWYSFEEFLGVLATTALLSLGAPFWFNALKTMTSLRPIVASKQKAEEQRAG